MQEDEDPCHESCLNYPPLTFSLQPSTSRLLAPQSYFSPDETTEESMEEEIEITIFENRQHKQTKKEDQFFVPLVVVSHGDEAKPLLLRNRIKCLGNITDEGERYRIDVAQRPDPPTPQSYQLISLARFGEGYLRALGWSPGTPIGDRNREVVPVVAITPLPRRGGLGYQPESRLKSKKRARVVAESDLERSKKKSRR